MRMIRSATAFLVVAALAVGCGPVVDGTAKPAPNLKPRPLTGDAVRQVPLDDDTLSRMLGQPFVGRMPPEFGGPKGSDEAGSAGAEYHDVPRGVHVLAILPLPRRPE